MKMDTPHDFFKTETAEPIVYVRPVDVSDLPDEVRDQAEGATEFFAVHAANGDRLALVTDRRLAFVLARQNHMTPVNVH